MNSNTLPVSTAVINPADQSLLFTTLSPQKVVVPDQFKTGVFSQDRVLNLPKGFHITVWAGGIKGSIAITFTAQNNAVVSSIAEGSIYFIKNNPKTNVSEGVIKMDSGLRAPHGVFYYKGDLYLGEENEIDVYRNLKEDGTFDKKEVLASLPTGGHITRTPVVGPDGKLYVSIGSSCNVCDPETDPRKATIVRYNLDGTGEEIFARGLRNTVDFTFHNTYGVQKIWGVDNGRDSIGDDIPPEEVNIIEQGKNYGWTFCYGKDYCLTETEAPVYEMQAHSAPLGLAFVPEASDTQKAVLPDYFKNDLFINFHGSWNRTIPTGYKTVRIDTSSFSNKPIDFITGWLDSTGNVWGRPVGIRFDQTGNIFIVDDAAGVIYKVTYDGN